MAKKETVTEEVAVADPSNPTESNEVDTDTGDDEFITLGKRRSTWKPGRQPIEGYLLGESGVPLKDGTVARTFVLRLTAPTEVSDWDTKEEKEHFRPAKIGEEIQIFATTGMTELRSY